MRFKKCHLHWWFTFSETQTFYKALSQVGTDFSLMTPIFPNRTRRELKVCGCCWFELKRDFFLLTPVSCPLHEFYVHLLLARFLSFFFSFLLFLQSQPSLLSTSSSLPSSFPRHPFVIPLPPSLSSPPSFPFNLSSSLRPPSIHSSHFPFHRLLLPLYPPFPFSLLHTCLGLFTPPPPLEPLFFLGLLYSPRSHSPIPFCLFFFSPIKVLTSLFRPNSSGKKNSTGLW